MSAYVAVSDFFVAGGTLSADSPSYVTRPADEELLQLVLTGEYAYVLTPRQLGKSSLMVRTARRLTAAGVHTAIVDLTAIGTQVTADQWYYGLASRLNSQLRLGHDLQKWWAEREDAGDEDTALRDHFLDQRDHFPLLGALYFPAACVYFCPEE